jgi:hypothetical protein
MTNYKLFINDDSKLFLFAACKFALQYGNTLRNKDGKPIRVAGTLIDIQALKDLQAVQVNHDRSNAGLK